MTSVRLVAAGQRSVLVAGVILVVLAPVLAMVGVWLAAALVLLAGVALVGVAEPGLGASLVLLLVPIHPLVTRVLQVDVGITGTPYLLLAAWKEVILAGAVVGAVGGALVRKDARLDRRSVATADVLAGALLALVAVTFVSHPTTLALNEARLLLFPIGVYVVFRLVPTDLPRLASALVAMAALIAAFGIVQSSFLGWGFVARYYGTAGDPTPATFIAAALTGPRAASTFLSPNELALAEVFYLCVAFGLATSGRRPRGPWLSAAIATIVVAIGVTFSRSALAAMVGALVAMGIVALLRRPAGTRRGALLLVGALIPALAVTTLVYAQRGGFDLIAATIVTVGGGAGAQPSPVEASPAPASAAPSLPSAAASPGFATPIPIPTGMPPEPSTIGHAESLASGLRLVASHPLGVGLGEVGSRPLPGSDQKPSIIVESWFLAMGLSLGWLGLLWAAAFPIVMLVRAVRVMPEPGFVLPAVAGVGLAVAIAIVGLLLPTMMEPEIAMTPWAVLAFLWPTATARIGSTDRDR